ncbi:hypothetical protein [Chryseobacterium daecheongense]|uniref:Uncharacterized protein n=1 Tax=Chryseobacterium daecheongense TaxID=192389 RepID=A0A3N0VYS1_9FLAO|nr:hypothetical protein [Chryseobacterium daecheongense]ROH97953.1 hypothetical protein EGI05_11430 [Chryseobacterium daecheongense]TDX92865.1 hypothetical protein BCF50_1806 [Chryseobacterium daecheongense]
MESFFSFDSFGNLVSFFGKIYYLFNIPIESSDYSSIDISTVIIGFSFIILNWYIFEHEDKWKTIIKEFDLLAKKTNRIGGIIVWILIILIVVLYWYSIFSILPKLTYI